MSAKQHITEKTMKTTKTAKPAQTAMDAYVAKMESIRTMIAELQDHADNFFGDDPDSINWSEVGDLGRIQEHLIEALMLANNK